MSHTPGPWKADPHRLKIGECVESHQIWASCRVAFIEEQNVGRDQAEANARLIAAAPDLLEACQSALRELRATDHRFPFEEAMEAAIAKATSVEGRQ